MPIWRPGSALADKFNSQQLFLKWQRADLRKGSHCDLELRRRVSEADVQVYAIGLTDSFSDDTWTTKQGKRVLAELAANSGGRAFFPNAYNEGALLEVCSRIAEELRHQYSIGFYPSNPRTGWHHLEIRLKLPKRIGPFHVSHRRGYQSSKP